jgi:hypothetical protein
VSFVGGFITGAIFVLLLFVIVAKMNDGPGDDDTPAGGTD